MIYIIFLIYIMDECSICLEQKNDRECIILDCNHIFHYDCIVKVDNNKCPLCRQIIIDNDVCPNNHSMNTYFNISKYKKNGTCTICGKKSYKRCFNDKFNIDNKTNIPKTIININFEYL